MTSNENAPAVRLPSDVRRGQATMVEQSRAVAEVEAAIVVAQRCPRSVPAAVDAMREACSSTSLAERAYFRFSRGGSQISGESVYLARELARCWGNIQYGVAELSRDDEHGQSEMQAWAWDVQTNTRTSTVFIVPHKRDKKGGPAPLVDMRDIYENNANNGARRVRECIFGVLPRWFIDQAKEVVDATLKHGGGKPLAQRVADAIRTFDALGVTRDQLEAKVGRVSGRWTEHDVAQLKVIYLSLSQGEVDRDEEFPPVRVTAGEITGGKPAEQAAPVDQFRDDDPDLTADGA